MQLSKQHKIYAAILGLAVAALAADQFVMAPPPAEEVAAAPVTPQRTERKPAAPSTMPAVASAPAEAGNAAIAQRLKTVAAQQGAPTTAADAFTPSTSWVHVPEKKQEAAVSPDIELAKQFLRQHRLTAVMKSGGGGIAVIDGKPYKPGQQIDGFRLASVGERSAVLRRGVAKIEIKLRGAKDAVAASE